MPLAARALALLYLAAAAAAACIGEFSTCPNGACALLASACGQCGAGLYACPLSSSCFAPGPAGAGFATCPGLAGTHFDATLPLAARLDAMFATPWTVAEFISQMTENATAIARLSLPAYSWLNDDQHGVKQADATAFPNGNSLGASWNAPLLTRVGLAIGVEARGTHNELADKSAETGGHQWPGTINNGAGLTLYAPNVNLVHDPRWGRAQEVMSECPKLTGDLVTAYVRGLQNNSAPKIADAGTLLTIACCKHYAVYNTETIPTDRHHFNAVVGARDMWETYLPVFEQCLGKAASQSIMCSYNAVNGVPACANGGLINTIARGTFGFEGFVMSDYDAWEEMVSTHAYVPTYAAAAAAGLSAGLDQEGGGGPRYPPVQDGIPAAVAAGTVTLAQLETSVRRLMLARLRLGMFDPPALNPYNRFSQADVASPEHLALAEEAARAGITLLKNDARALPLALRSGDRIALLGPNANASYGLLGSYSDHFCCTAGIPSLLDELSARAAAAGATVSYAPGCADAAGAASPACAASTGFAAAAAAAAGATHVVIVLGMGNSNYNCGGAADRADCEAEGYDRVTCALPRLQPALVAAVRAALPPGVPLVGVLLHGGALCLDAPTLAAMDALVDGWYPGMRGGAALADALIGAFSPSGRSPVSWYASDAALPADRGEMSPYPNASTGSPGLTYRFYDEAVGAPRIFTFSEGLSYTTFAVASARAAPAAGPCDDITLAVAVTNTGSVDSDVVVAVFLDQPDVTVPAPASRLATFARVFVPAGATRNAPLPPVDAAVRAVIHDDGGDVYAVAGKRWNEAGRLNFRVTLGEHGADRAGGTAVLVTQFASRDISTC